MNPFVNFILIISAAVVSFLITRLSTKLLIKFSSRRQIAQIERNYLEENKKKRGTATGGGIAFVTATIITSLIFAILSGVITDAYWALLLVFSMFFAVGLIDDGLKIFKKSTNGLPGAIRLFFEFVIVMIGLKIAGFEYQGLWYLRLDIIKISIYLGILFIFLALFLVVGMANSVNLSDGLDGLAGGLVLIALAPFLLLSVKNDFAVAIFIFSLIGSLLGFLRYNFHPARIFMGDCGSLALGSALAFIAIILKGELVLLIAAFWLLIEAGSVMIQVGSYKIIGKRVLLMAPFHHHLQKRGWVEWKIVMFFWLIAFVFTLLALSVVIL